MTDIAVGASTWASGNQVWNGKAGILIAKPIKSATHNTTGTDNPNSIPLLSQSEWFAWFIIASMSKVCRPAWSVTLKWKARIEINIKALPTRV